MVKIYKPANYVFIMFFIIGFIFSLPGFMILANGILSGFFYIFCGLIPIILPLKTWLIIKDDNIEYYYLFKNRKILFNDIESCSFVKMIVCGPIVGIDLKDKSGKVFSINLKIFSFKDKQEIIEIINQKT